MLSDVDARRLHYQGWVELQGWSLDRPEATLSALAAVLGKPSPSRPGGGLLDYLQPTTHSIARAASLSRQHGTGAFPLHTDTAHWPVPARYLVLCCLNPGGGDRGTLLLPISGLELSDQDIAVLNSGVFLVRNARQSWFSSVLMSRRPFVRYDRGCMSPATASGAESARLMEKSIANSSPVRIGWEEGTILIVDNWRVLHGREAADGDSGRMLLRMLVLSTNNGRSDDRF